MTSQRLPYTLIIYYIRYYAGIYDYDAQPQIFSVITKPISDVNSEEEEEKILGI